MRNQLLLLAVCTSLCQLCLCDILWKGCVGIADNPQGKNGFYYDLCIKNHKFVQRRAPFQFIDTTLINVEFDAATFVNTNQYSINFTNSVFTNVLFKNTVFGSYVVKPRPVLLDRTAMRHVTFERCRFDKSAELIFSEFEMTNVTFRECIFESSTLFKLGTMQDVSFVSSSFLRSPSAVTTSNDTTINFDRLTTRAMSFVKSKFSQPLVFENVNAADTHFNDTSFNQFWCHEKSTPANSSAMKPSAFNDTIFQSPTFSERVYCAHTTFRGLSMWNAKFHADANFSRSFIQHVNWNNTEMSRDFEGDCATLDLSKSEIRRGLLSNMVMQCELDMRKTIIEKVLFTNVRARSLLLEQAQFNQERVDGECCTAVCPKYDCRCNYTRSPFDTCPVDLNAPRPQPKRKPREPYWITLLRALGFLPATDRSKRMVPVQAVHNVTYGQ